MITLLTRYIGSTIVIAINILIWVYQYETRSQLESVSFNFEKITRYGQYWRFISSTFTHINLVHLALNSISLWQLRFLEQSIGLYQYVKYSFFILLSSNLMMMFFISIVNIQRPTLNLKDRNYIGYSCVCFGLSTYYSLIHFGFSNLSIFTSLLFTQILFPNASFIGHLFEFNAELGGSPGSTTSRIINGILIRNSGRISNQAEDMV
ncbi:hypothetical protein DFA_06017 [Cavenderia fasciculata]|uniref:Peptidase S54 rhomboid domain-containing protein n=1 Tax=Cavenderia fasciculata TaxID=261658 RepID=F4PJV5_CACFS|nr:uncharacterized protein DFA_06017 [Cavenderia fasciculata]EGG23879.1 hypothetical protein DFA_06017 [Cavenderia fasciculata]|eukprot:XP_004361730.1 hypothetical protein DFA_06017 [Cavenderia fasciculata]